MSEPQAQPAPKRPAPKITADTLQQGAVHKAFPPARFALKRAGSIAGGLYAIDAHGRLCAAEWGENSAAEVWAFRRVLRDFLTKAIEDEEQRIKVAAEDAGKAIAKASEAAKLEAPEGAGVNVTTS
jgi:hypothetical protein